MATVELKVNGVSRRLEAEPEQTLLGALRDQLGLTGTKYGCGEGQCGACTVLVDGRATRSCQTRAAAAAGSAVTTIEGLAGDGRLHPVQEAFVAADAAPAQESGRSARSEETPQEIAAWLHVAEDGTVTVYTGKVEFGQDIRTSLTQAVAEELHAPLESVRLVMGDTDLTPFDMGTFGSRTTPIMAAQLRKVAAAAREALVDMAAEQWKGARETPRVAEGRVSEPAGGRAAGFGQLTGGRKLVRQAGDVATTPPKEWTIAGRSIRKVNARDMVTGSHRSTSDL